MRYAKTLPTKSKFIKVKYTGIVELSEELEGISPTSNLTCSGLVLAAGMNAVLTGKVRVERVYDSRYELGLHEGPKVVLKERKRAARSRS